MALTRRLPIEPPRLSKLANLQQVAERQEAFNREVLGILGGLPAGFGATVLPLEIAAGVAASKGQETSGWAAANHRHPLNVTGTPGGLGTTSAQGNGPGVSLSGHTHRRDVWVEEDGVDLGTVNALNWVDDDVVVEPNLTGSLLTDLIGYWPFDEVRGTRKIAIGAGPDLLEVGGGVASAAGRFELGIEADKVDTQYLEGNIAPMSFPGGVTFGIWFWLADNPSVSPSGLVSINNSAGTDWLFLTRYFDSDFIEFGVQSPTGVLTAAAIPGPYTRNAWHLALCWWDSVSGVIEMQVDGGPIYNRDFLPSSIVPTLGTWTFDRIRVGRGVGGQISWHGRADAFLLWEKTLTDAEREQVWTSTRASISTAAVVADALIGDSSLGPSAQEQMDLEIRAAFDSLALRQIIASTFR